VSAAGASAAAAVAAAGCGDGAGNALALAVKRVCWWERDWSAMRQWCCSKRMWLWRPGVEAVLAD
jgi:hypothetical protein